MSSIEKSWIQVETEHVGTRATASATREGVSLLMYDRGGGQIIRLRPGQPLVVGREPPADVHLRDGTVSRQHARFELAQGTIWVEDFGSRNGTFVNGAPVQRAIVAPGDEVMLGAVAVAITQRVESPFYRIRSHEAFLTHLEREMVRAREYARPFVLVVIRSRDEQGGISRWCQGIGALLRPFDCMGIYGFNTVEVLLPELGADGAAALAQRIVTDAAPAAHLCCGIATYPDAGGTIDSLVEASCAAVQRATAAAPIEVAATQTLKSLPGSRHAPGDEVPELVAQSAGMRAVVASIKRLAQTAIGVIIQGETGTGKEVVARAIHEQGPRRAAKMCSVNCGAIPDQLLESVLFGHERGAFTGAHRPTKGVFEAADGGTLLLDEIGELPLPAQTALLRVLETKRVMRVGATTEIPVDVRILAATHQDLEKMCAAGTFRWDLYYRLNGMSVRVPPLREHPDDIPALVGSFVLQSNGANRCQVPGLHPDAMAVLLEYRWPGNIRELKNTIERAVVLAHDKEITPEDLPDVMWRTRAPATDAGDHSGAHVLPLLPAAPAAPAPPSFAGLADGELDFRTVVEEHLRQLECALIAEALRRTTNSQTEAAQLLHLPLRTLVRKIKAYGLGRRSTENDE